MINEAYLRKYCCEDISLIENYNEAINSSEKWQCHHKLEITLHKTRQELIEMGLYFNRPASELICLSEKKHKQLHYKNGLSNYGTKYGKEHPMYGKHRTNETKQKISESHKGIKHTEETRLKMSITRKGKSIPSLRKPKPKYKWLTPTGEIREMSIPNAKNHHPDWILIGEV